MEPGMGNEEAIGAVALILISVVSLACLALYVWSVVWAYGDAEKRGKSGCLVALLVGLVSWPMGLIIWLVARPENRR